MYGVPIAINALRQLLQSSAKVGKIHWFPEEPTLGKLYCTCVQELGLGLGLNSLGQNNQVEGVGHADDMGYHLAGCAVRPDRIGSPKNDAFKPH